VRFAAIDTESTRRRRLIEELDCVGFPICTSQICATFLTGEDGPLATRAAKSLSTRRAPDAERRDLMAIEANLLDVEVAEFVESWQRSHATILA
jgi:hypothetical protein